MICQECKQRTATVHFTKIINGEKSEFHLCEPCAREKGDLMMGQSGGGFTLNNLLSGLLNFDPTGGPVPAQQPMRCETCGMTYAQFSQVGRFGCADCYQSFASRLDPLLRRIHGSTTHTGKVPERSGGMIKKRKELHELRQQLQQKVQLEQFEEAAMLRDRIRALENEIEQG
jgi:protein arginine kinase activator